MTKPSRSRTNALYLQGHALYREAEEMEVAAFHRFLLPLCSDYDSGREVLADKKWVKATLREFRKWHRAYQDFRERWGLRFSDSPVECFIDRVEDVRRRPVVLLRSEVYEHSSDRRRANRLLLAAMSAGVDGAKVQGGVGTVLGRFPGRGTTEVLSLRTGELGALRVLRFLRREAGPVGPLPRLRAAEGFMVEHVRGVLRTRAVRKGQGPQRPHGVEHVEFVPSLDGGGDLLRVGASVAAPPGDEHPGGVQGVGEGGELRPHQAPYHLG